MSDATQLICLRHGHSTNVESGISGAVPNAALTALGQEQARATARGLEGAGATSVYTSEAQRARRTGQIIADALALPLSTCADLGETHLGRLDGATGRELAEETGLLLHRWVVEGDLSASLGDGESGLQVLSRMQCALEAIAVRHAGENVIVVGHVGSLTTAVAHLTSLGPQVWGSPLLHGMPFRMKWHGNRFTSRGWPGASNA